MVLEELTQDEVAALERYRILEDKFARMTNEVLKIRKHLSDGGAYAIEREDKQDMGMWEKVMWGDIFTALDALLPDED